MYRSIRFSQTKPPAYRSCDWLTRNSTVGPFRAFLRRLACFSAVQIAAALHVARMRGHSHIGHAEEMSGNDRGNLKAIEVLRSHLGQNPLQRALLLRRPQRSEEHRLDFRSHEKEIPSSSMDLAIKSECIRHLDHAPLPQAGFSFKPVQVGTILMKEWPGMPQLIHPCELVPVGGLYLYEMRPALAAKKNGGFDPSIFLATIGEGRKILSVPKKKMIFAQGDEADAVFYVQKGKVRLTVVSKIGKEATIAIVGEGNFFGEGSLAGQLLRMGSAVAMTDCEILRVEKKAMFDILHREPAFSERFVAYLLGRNIRYEEDLVDQLFNSSEKRLARVLLLLAHFGKDGIPETVVPKISQETLAEMVGTTRSRVSFFMNRFRRLGFIDYAGGSEGALQVHGSLLNVVLHD
jgi:CRP/FNR family cyclic AMP-dependent transcriptional regulator